MIETASKQTHNPEINHPFCGQLIFNAKKPHQRKTAYSTNSAKKTWISTSKNEIENLLHTPCKINSKSTEDVHLTPETEKTTWTEGGKMLKG